MKPTTRIALSLAGIYSASILPFNPSSTAEPRRASQGVPTVCAVIDTTFLQRITGRRDYLNRPPNVVENSIEGPERSSCMYVEVSYELASPMKPGTFASDRAFLEKGGAKTAPASGVGDEAYYWWSPKPGRTRPIGIVFRTGSRQLNIYEVTSSDSIEIYKPRMMALAKSAAARLK